TFEGRALAYGDLRAVAPTALPPGPARPFTLALQGDMAKYVWTINGQVYPKTDPLLIRQGDRVEIELRNETLMWHPMHLHGHFFPLLQRAGERAPLKHTVNVAPRETVRIEFAADNPGGGSSTATTSITAKPAWRESSSTKREVGWRLHRE